MQHRHTYLLRIHRPTAIDPDDRRGFFYHVSGEEDIALARELLEPAGYVIKTRKVNIPLRNRPLGD
jgi:hypothetical protein